MAQRSIEPLLLSLDPGAGSGPQPIIHPGQEFVFCLEGRICYRVDGQRYLLEPGDSLLFESTLPHSWENTDPSPARALLVLCPSEPAGSAAARHGLPNVIRDA
jgi:quercetin dioxygenase-like cupin family protein